MAFPITELASKTASKKAIKEAILRFVSPNASGITAAVTDRKERKNTAVGLGISKAVAKNSQANQNPPVTEASLKLPVFI